MTKTSDPIGPFRFRFTLFDVVTEERDRQLIMKLGLKMQVVDLDHIRYLYYRDLRDQEMSEITVAQGEGDSLKRVRLYADLKDEGFLSMWRYLVSQNPDADISSKPIREAYTLMGSQNQPWRAVAAVMSVGVLLIALFQIPLLLHALDSGRAHLDLERAYVGGDSPYASTTQPLSTQSKNIVFSGWIDLSQSWGHHLSSQTVKDRSQPQNLLTATQEVELIAPLYPASTEGEAPPQVALLVHAYGDEAVKILKDSSVLQREGVVRDIWWEGLGDHARRGLSQRGLKLTQHVKLIEVGAISTQRRDDLIVYLSTIGALALMTLFITLYLKPPHFKA